MFLGRKDFSFSSLQTKPGIKKLLQDADEKIINDAGVTSGWQGKTLPFWTVAMPKTRTR